MAVQATPTQQLSSPIAGFYPPAPLAYMQAGPFKRVLLIGVGAVLVAMALDVWLGRPVDVGSPAAASGVLVLAGTVAVAIERLMEFFWTLMDQMANNPSAPFHGDANRLEHFAAQVGRIVTPAVKQAQDVLTTVGAAAAKGPATFDDVQAQVAALQAAVTSIVDQGNPHASGGLVTIRNGLDDLGRVLAHPQARASVVAASQAVDALKKLVDTAADDPGRRIMSLFIGVILGVIASGVLGLDVIHAALGVPAQSISLWNSQSISAWWQAGLAAWPWGMVATGVAIGLGSNPLHELIQTIQNWKASTWVSSQPS